MYGNELQCGRYYYLYVAVVRNKFDISDEDIEKYFTNDENYWYYPKGAKNNDKHFMIDKDGSGNIAHSTGNNVEITAGTKDWIKPVKGWRNAPITLGKTYNNTKWEEYPVCSLCTTKCTNSQFMYLIEETK